MKKELFSVILLLGLPTFFIMSLGGESTGSLTQEVSQLRVERIQLYLNYPSPVYNRVHKMLSYRVRNGLRLGANDKYYENTGLRLGHEFFNNEIILVGELLKSACLRPTEFISNGKFISPGGIKITMPNGRFFGQIQDIGQVPCDQQLQEAAERTLFRVLDIDMKMVGRTIQYSRCPDYAMESYERGAMNIIEGNVEAALTNMRVAWSKARTCA